MCVCPSGYRNLANGWLVGHNKKPNVLYVQKHAPKTFVASVPTFSKCVEGIKFRLSVYFRKKKEHEIAFLCTSFN